MHRSALLSGLKVLVPLVVAAHTWASAQEAPPSAPALPSPEELSFRKAFMIANACEAAYMEGDAVHQMLRAMGIDRHRFLDLGGKKGASDTQVLAASIEGYTLLCFRGTSNLKDWKTNVQTSPRRFSIGGLDVGSVHTGFWNAWVDVKPDVIQYLKEQKATNANETTPGMKCHEILIGGHSLGGAVALIAGLELMKDGYQVLGVFTFGQPKVFSKEVERAYETSPGFFPDIQRYVFDGDPVPTLPPGYTHIGPERYSREIGKILEQTRNDYYWPSVGDHGMANYVKTLTQLILSLSRSSETVAMANWIKDRNAPLVSYLKLPRKEAAAEGEVDAALALYSDPSAAGRVRCREEN